MIIFLYILQFYGTHTNRKKKDTLAFVKGLVKHMLFFISNAISIQPQCCLIFSWIKLQKSLRCCLINVSIFILRHFLYFLYLCPYLDLGLFLSYLCDLFFIFVFILTMINHIIPSKQGHLFCFRVLWIFHIIFGWRLAKVQSKGVA